MPYGPAVETTAKARIPDASRGNSLHQGAGNVFELAGKLQGRAGSWICRKREVPVRALKAEQEACSSQSDGKDARIGELGAERGWLPALLERGGDLRRQQRKGQPGP